MYLVHGLLLLSLATFSRAAQAPKRQHSTILVPCTDTPPHHAIIPDTSCQLISTTGAFSIASLSDVQPGVALGFSSTPDCKLTYAPAWQELVQLQQDQVCRKFALQGEDKGVEVPQKKERRPDDGESEGGNWIRRRDGFLVKRADGDEKKEGGDVDVNTIEDSKLAALWCVEVCHACSGLRTGRRRGREGEGERMSTSCC